MRCRDESDARHPGCRRMPSGRFAAARRERMLNDRWTLCLRTVRCPARRHARARLLAQSRAAHRRAQGAAGLRQPCRSRRRVIDPSRNRRRISAGCVPRRGNGRVVHGAARPLLGRRSDRRHAQFPARRAVLERRDRVHGTRPRANRHRVRCRERRAVPRRARRRCMVRHRGGNEASCTSPIRRRCQARSSRSDITTALRMRITSKSGVA